MEFAFSTVDGHVLASAELRGRVTLLLFVTTFDISSQEQAKRLEDVFRTHAPRVNAVAVVLEAPRYIQVSQTFREMLQLNYPVAMADQATLMGEGPFGQVNVVPTWVMLDRHGRLGQVFRGPLGTEDIKRLIASLE